MSVTSCTVSCDGNGVFSGNWLGENGFGENGFGENGFGENGFGENGFGENGFGENGFGENGFGENGVGFGTVPPAETVWGSRDQCSPANGFVTTGVGKTTGLLVSVEESSAP